MKNRPLKTKIMLYITVSIITFVTIILPINIFLYNNGINKEIKEFRTIEENRSRTKIQEQVEIAYKIIDLNYKKAKGKNNLKEVLENTLKTISSIRFNNNQGYIWINNTEYPYPKMIMHPISPELMGKAMDDPKYNGIVIGHQNKHLFTAFVDICKENGKGFISYLWPKPDKEKPQPKLSYIKEYKPLNWIIGSGVYIDNIEDAVKHKQDSLLKMHKKNSLIIIITTFFIIITVLIALNFFLNIRFAKPMACIVEIISKVSKGDLSKKAALSNQSKEITSLATAVNTMIDNFKLMTEEINVIALKAKQGELKSRGNHSNLEGEFSNIIKQINYTLETVTSPFNKLLLLLNEMANGNLEIFFDGSYQGDFQTLQATMNKTIHSLNEILIQARIGADQVAIGADQISTGSQNLSQGASRSASSLEEISSSMHLIKEQIKQNTQNAMEANSLSNDSLESAKHGSSKMSNMVQAMEEINKSSKNISKIIKVINDIAFQTNLLSLNAAVEAASAGKHGKGFAVVAEEVRNLAARSAKAADETNQLIQESLDRVEAGTNIAIETNKALEEIVSHATKVSDLVDEISAASKEQTRAIDEVTQGLDDINTVTQSNSANAEESAAAAEEFINQAKTLKNMLDHFKLIKTCTIGNRAKNYNSANSHPTPTNPPVSLPFKPAELSRESQINISLDDNDFGKF